MPLANLWGKLNPTNLIAEFVIVTLSVIAALAGDKYLDHRATLEHEQKALQLIHQDLQANQKQLNFTTADMIREDSVFVSLLKHAAGDTTLSDSTVNAAFIDLTFFMYFDRSVAQTANYDSKIKHAGKQVIQSDSLQTALNNYYDSKLNNLAGWTESRMELVFDLSREITKAGLYTDKGQPYIRRIQDKSYSQNISELTSSIRIMGIAADILWHNGHHRANMERTGKTLRSIVELIEAYFEENDVDYEPFDPGATWE